MSIAVTNMLSQPIASRAVGGLGVSDAGVQETHGLSLSALRAPGLGRISPVVKMWCLRALALGLVLCSLCFVWRSYQGMGLFLNLGTDYALYLAQSTVMDSGATSQIYDLSAADGPYRNC